MAAGLLRGSRAAAGVAVDEARAAPAPAVLARGGGHRPARGRAQRRTSGACRVRAHSRRGARRAGRISADRRDRGVLEGRPPDRRRRQQHLRARAGRARSRPLRQGASRALTANICRCGLCCRRSVCPGSLLATSISTPARVRARLRCRAGARSASSCATKSSSRARSWIGAIVPTSSSTHRTTPGSDAGARRSISPRRGSARPRKGIPVIRSTPTGISAVIDANGAIVEALRGELRA